MIETDRNNLLKSEKEKKQKERTFNGLTALEWASKSKSVWNDVSSPRKSHHLVHGATFPEKLATRVISIYSKAGDIVLDPFLGTGTTLIAALKAGRKAIGIELSEEFYNLAITQVEKVCTPLLTTYDYKIIHGDCLEELPNLKAETVQLTFTSPPYANLLHKVLIDRKFYHKKSLFVLDNNSTSKPYSDMQQDLGNMELETYMKKIDEIMRQLFCITRNGGYNIWVVKDFRDTKNGIPYVDFHTMIAESGKRAGFLYHDLIIWDQNAQRSLVLLGYPSVFYTNQNHSFIIVLRKKVK